MSASRIRLIKIFRAQFSPEDIMMFSGDTLETLAHFYTPEDKDRFLIMNPDGSFMVNKNRTIGFPFWTPGLKDLQIYTSAKDALDDADKTATGSVFLIREVKYNE